MPSNEEISEILRAKREGRDPKKLAEKLKIAESQGYLSVIGYGHRLIMEPNGITMEEGLIPYKSINSIYKEKDPNFYGKVKLKIMFNGGKITLKKVNPKDADKFIRAVRKKLEEVKEEKIENQNIISPIDEIKKAKELLDIGALTKEEFTRIKEKYLEKI